MAADVARGSPEWRKRRGRKAREAQEATLVLELTPTVRILRDSHNLILEVNGRRSYFTGMLGVGLGLLEAGRAFHWGRERMAELRDLVRAELELYSLLENWLRRIHVRFDLFPELTPAASTIPARAEVEQGEIGGKSHGAGEIEGMASAEL